MTYSRAKRLVAVSERIQDRMDRRQISLHQAALACDVSYEMARRYARGIAMPPPAVLHKLARCLDTTVGYIVNGEGELGGELALYMPSEINHPVKSIIRMAVHDNAMTVAIDGWWMFSIGDQVVLQSDEHRIGDIVALKPPKSVTTLRLVCEGADGTVFAPRAQAFATYTPKTATVLAVVTGVVAVPTRFARQGVIS